MRASKLLNPNEHTHGPDGWQGTLTREDAQDLGGHLCRGFANNAPRGTSRHQRLVKVLARAITDDGVFLALDEARTLMSAWRLTYDGTLETECGEVAKVETLETGVKVYPERSVKQHLLAAFNRTFPRGKLFDVQAVAR